MTTETIIETVECPNCGHDAKFMHAKDNTFGVLYCEQCKAEIVAEGTARTHKLIEEVIE